MKKHNVAIVMDTLLKWGGAEETLKVLLELYPNATIYTSIADKELVNEHFPKNKVVTSIIERIPFNRKFMRELYLLHPIAFRLFNFKKYDAVISITSSFAKFIKTPKHVPHIMNCLTPPKFFWMHQSRTIESMQKFSYKFYRFFVGTFLEKIWQRWDRNAAKKADVAIAISQAVSDRMKTYYGIESEVVYPPVDTKSLKYNSDIDGREKWFLYLGRVETYKGVDLAIKACVKAHVPLKIAGTGQHVEQMRELVKDLNAKGIIKFLGFVEDDMKKDLLFRCKGLIFPVRDEDFGIVPVEANASGAPVIAYKSGGVLETISEKNPRSGVFFEKYKVSELAKVLVDFDKYDFDSANCRKQANQFDKEIFKYKFGNLVNDSVQSFKKSD